MIDKRTPPDWVLIEASKRFGIKKEAVGLIGCLYATHPGFVALCDMIERYEQPPVDCNPVDGLKQMPFDEFAALPKGIKGRPVLYAVWPSPIDGDDK